MIFHHTNKKIERLKDTFVIVWREIKAVNTSFIWNFENSFKKFTRREALLLLINLANLKSKTVKCFGITFSTKRSEIRAHHGAD
jgi:hypothetical protein